LALGNTEFSGTNSQSFSAKTLEPLPTYSASIIARLGAVLNATQFAEFTDYGSYTQFNLANTANIPNLNKVMVIVLNTMVCNTLNLQLLGIKGDVAG
jgi:hypothetical protein